MKYTYFVSYYLRDRDRSLGMGSCEVTLTSRMKSQELTDLREALKKKSNHSEVVILNFILLKKAFR